MEARSNNKDIFVYAHWTGMEVIVGIKKSVTKWRSVANKYQLPKSEQELMAKVFDRFL